MASPEKLPLQPVNNDEVVLYSPGKGKAYQIDCANELGKPFWKEDARALIVEHEHDKGEMGPRPKFASRVATLVHNHMFDQGKAFLHKQYQSEGNYEVTELDLASAVKKVAKKLEKQLPSNRNRNRTKRPQGKKPAPVSSPTNVVTEPSPRGTSLVRYSL